MQISIGAVDENDLFSMDLVCEGGFGRVCGFELSPRLI